MNCTALVRDTAIHGGAEGKGNDMRIVSFNEVYDAPYEFTMLYSYGRIVMAKFVGGESKPYCFGDYDSEEDAKFVIKFARVAKTLGWPGFRMFDAEQAKNEREDYEKNRKPGEMLITYILRKTKDGKDN